MRSFIIGPVAALSLIGCTADTSSDSGAGDAEVQVNSDYLEMDGVDSSMCGEDYSVCGDLLIPDTFTGTPRSLAVALYTSIPPAGPPAGIVAEIDGPDIYPNIKKTKTLVVSKSGVNGYFDNQSPKAKFHKS